MPRLCMYACVIADDTAGESQSTQHVGATQHCKLDVRLDVEVVNLDLERPSGPSSGP